MADHVNTISPLIVGNKNYNCRDKRECEAICCYHHTIKDPLYLNPIDVGVISTEFSGTYFLERVDKPLMIMRTEHDSGKCILLDNDYSCSLSKMNGNKQPLTCRNFPFKYSERFEGLIHYTYCSEDRISSKLVGEDIDELEKRVRLEHALRSVNTMYAFSAFELCEDLGMSATGKNNRININKILAKMWNESDNLRTALKKHKLPEDFKGFSELVSSVYQVQ